MFQLISVTNYICSMLLLISDIIRLFLSMLGVWDKIWYLFTNHGPLFVVYNHICVKIPLLQIHEYWSENKKREENSNKNIGILISVKQQNLGMLSLISNVICSLQTLHIHGIDLREYNDKNKQEIEIN